MKYRKPRQKLNRAANRRTWKKGAKQTKKNRPNTSSRGGTRL